MLSAMNSIEAIIIVDFFSNLLEHSTCSSMICFLAAKIDVRRVFLMAMINVSALRHSMKLLAFSLHWLRQPNSAMWNFDLHLTHQRIKN